MDLSRGNKRLANYWARLNKTETPRRGATYATPNPYAQGAQGLTPAQIQAQQGFHGFSANQSGNSGGHVTGAVGGSYNASAEAARYTAQARNALGIGRMTNIPGLNRGQTADALRLYEQFFASPAGIRDAQTGARWNMLTYRSLFGQTGRTVPYGAGFTSTPTDPLGMLDIPDYDGGGGGGGGGDALYNPNLGLTNWRI